jgi:type I restriction enzyme R subunit
VTDGLLVAADLLMDTDFNEGDRLLMVQALDDLSGDQTLEAQARTNTLDNFRHAFEPAAIDAILNRNQRNGEITEQFMGNPELRRMMLDAMMLDYYERARRAEPDDRSAA